MRWRPPRSRASFTHNIGISLNPQNCAHERNTPVQPCCVMTAEDVDIRITMRCILVPLIGSGKY